MTTRAIQSNLVDLLPKCFKPAAPLDAVRVFLTEQGFDYTADDLLGDIDEGRFEWCWNIAAKSAVRKDMRLFWPCVEQHLAWLKNPKANRRQFTIGDVGRALFPLRNDKPWVESPDVRRALVCSQEHVITLIDERSLLQLSETEYRRGKGGAALIDWRSVTAFLEHRRI